jgi:hypothetical protein
MKTYKLNIEINEEDYDHLKTWMAKEEGLNFEDISTIDIEELIQNQIIDEITDGNWMMDEDENYK